MKKNLFLLVLIFSILVVSPVKTFAQVGSCVYPSGGVASGYTQAQCAGANGTWIIGTNTSPASSVSSSPSSSSIFCSLPANPLFQDLTGYVTCIISRSVIPLIFALAAASFVWGVVQYVINNDEEAKKEKGKQFMIWGIIGLTVMFSVWGLVKVLGHTFGIENAIPQTHVQ